MNLDFTAILNTLGPDAAFRIANAARPRADYLFASFLPETNMFDYTVKSGAMTVRSTMAGLAALDSPYPPTGIITASSFLAEAAKIANEVELNEYTIRTLQQMMMQLQLAGEPTNERLQNEVLNFLDNVIVQAHLDTMEWLRGQSLVEGAIDWDFNNLNVTVDYGIPTANILAVRSGTAAWDSTASTFWSDVRSLRQLLKYNVRAFVAHPDTIDAIISNPDNNILVTQQVQGGTTTVRRLVGTNETPSSDAREVLTLIAYGHEAEVLDPTTAGATVTVPFMPRGKILAVGNGTLSGYRVGMGSASEDPLLQTAIGHTHLAPTVEGGGRPGRWAELYVPQNQPMKLRGRGVTNGLPVIMLPEQIAIARSDLLTIGVDL